MHDRLGSLFGPANLEGLLQLSLLARRGHLVNRDGKEVYLPHLERLALPATFLHGSDNMCVLPKSTALTSLPGHSVYVVRIERLETGPSRSELRYFDPRQQALARALVRQVGEGAAAPRAVRDSSTRYDMIPNHFELWLAP